MEVSCFGQKIHKNSSTNYFKCFFFYTFFVSKKEKFTQVWKNMRVRVIDKILEHFVSVNVLFMYFPVYNLNHLDDLSSFWFPDQDLYSLGRPLQGSVMQEDIRRHKVGCMQFPSLHPERLA